MNLHSLGCKRFSRLSSEQTDRVLSEREDRFLTRHRNNCHECRHAEETSTCALNMLRMAAIEPDLAEVPSMFEDRIIRRLKVQQVKESLNYWSPALVGAGIACVVVFVALHLVSAPSDFKRASLPAGEARRELSNQYVPRLELDHTPTIR